MSKLKEMADQIRKNMSKESQRVRQGILRKLRARKKEIIELFEMRFETFLPMFKKEGITYKACFQDDQYEHMGSYILFKQGKKELRMDFNTGHSFRLEFVPYSRSIERPNYGTMQYGNWPDEKFIVFIVEGLIEKPEPKRFRE